ncbi:MAG: DEAD/DEAH box helicase [Euryarchaeota archaeon]|nr:DEAD/DEAH box helicase [Euryarchaeota archaeon]
MKSFSLLGREVKEALSDLGFRRPTDIQELAIPRILEGGNVLLIAPTGIGKTEAALLPVFHRLVELRPKGISVLYITPLRALNRDLMERLTWWGERLGIKIAVRHGDTPTSERRKQSLSPPDLLITTPETLQAILPGSVMKGHLRNVRWVVVDEIHELAEDKRGAQLSLGLERLEMLIQKAGGGRVQRIGISATIGSPELVARFLAKDVPVEVLKTPILKEMEIKVERPRARKGDRALAERLASRIDASSRLRRISELVKAHRAALIFVNTREMAEVLASRFRILGEGIGIHHSSLSQEVRIATEQEFKAQRMKALICTSSLELGIDVGAIDLVVQYNSPRQVTRMLQRVGRSGHTWGRRSRGVIITGDAEDTLEALVIARKAVGGELEDVTSWKKPYDVLAHQLVGLALDWGSVTREEALRVARSSCPYEELTEGELEEILRILQGLRLIRLEGEGFRKTLGSWKYYFENLSTIPDERRYRVRNLVTHGSVGVLDEAFIANYADAGNLIIFRGAPWRVVSVEDGEVEVEPVDEVAGAIPSWVGEEIPIPYAVAQEVGRLRREIGERGLEALKDYPADLFTKRTAVHLVRRQTRKGLPVPDDRKVVVELIGGLVVIQACVGMGTNQALGRIFSTLLTARLGHSVALQTDAYRITLHSPYPLKREDIEELFAMDPDAIEPLLSRSLKKNSLFRWKFVHVAKRFGALSKDFSYTSGGIGRMVEGYDGTVLYREALKEVFKENLDLEGASKVLGAIKGGEIEVEWVEPKGPSPIAALGLKGYQEVILPQRAERLILKALKARIEERRVELFCLYCTGWWESYRVKNVPEDMKCPQCGARMLAVLKGRGRELRSLYKKFKSGKGLINGEREEAQRMQASANLFLSYGRMAVAVQAARGIGPEVGKRVLLGARDEEGLYRGILKAERDYARTKKFW